MKRLGLILLVLVACQETEIRKDEFTGNEVVYPLGAGSQYNVSGIVTIKEQTDLSARIFVELIGIEGTLERPVHLHLGTISTPNAEVAALLNPIMDKTGKSETLLTKLANETTISYAELLQLSACIKVHLITSGPDRDVILAAGDIGTAVYDAANARMNVAVCQ